MNKPDNPIMRCIANKTNSLSCADQMLVPRAATPYSAMYQLSTQKTSVTSMPENTRKQYHARINHSAVHSSDQGTSQPHRTPHINPVQQPGHTIHCGPPNQPSSPVPICPQLSQPPPRIPAYQLLPESPLQTWSHGPFPRWK